MKKTTNTLVSTVNVKASKHQIKQAVEKLYGTKMVEANICNVWRKECLVCLAGSYYDALDVTNKTEII